MCSLNLIHFSNIFLFLQDDHIKIEELHKRRNHLAVFCKLVVYNVFPAKTAAEVTFTIETHIHVDRQMGLVSNLKLFSSFYSMEQT